MINTITLSDLRKHLDHAKARLSLEKATLLKLHPLSADFNREEYAFAYVRAERIGMKAINRRLHEIDWLPMQLDTQSEIMGDGRSSMRRWVAISSGGQPDSDDFGNDFIHTLARAGLECGWDSAAMIKLMIRVANVFRDLSCLIGILYYCSWLEDNKVEAVHVSDPDNLNRTAEEITALIQSPEIYRVLRAQEQDDHKKGSKKKSLSKPVKKERPALRVIENDHYYDPYSPDPVMV